MHRRCQPAKDQYEAELRVNQSDPVLLNNLGNVYRDLGSYDKALEVYQRSISLDTGAVTAYMNLANLYQYTLTRRISASRRSKKRL